MFKIIKTIQCSIEVLLINDLLSQKCKGSMFLVSLGVVNIDFEILARDLNVPGWLWP